jgi:hypothetical protein
MAASTSIEAQKLLVGTRTGDRDRNMNAPKPGTADLKIPFKRFEKDNLEKVW